MFILFLKAAPESEVTLYVNNSRIHLKNNKKIKNKYIKDHCTRKFFNYSNLMFSLKTLLIPYFGQIGDCTVEILEIKTG